MPLSDDKHKPVVVILGFLDTKLEEHTLVYERLTALECNVKVFDLSVRKDSTPAHLPVAFTPDYIRRQSSTPLDSISASILNEDRGKILDIMVSGASRIVKDLYDNGLLHGLIGLGGSTTSAVVANIMREVKIGIPKLIVSTMASGDVSEYIGDTDITIMPSIVDISGKLNDISSRILKNASAAISGMAHECFTLSRSTPESDILEGSATETKRIAITMFGLTTPGVTAVMRYLETFTNTKTGKPMYSPVVFHATGAGGRSMERLISENWFDGVIDLTTTELADDLVGGVLSAGPNRLTAASLLDPPIPQVISLGALDMVNFGSPSTVPSSFTSANPARVFHEHNSSVTLMRTSKEECEELGRRIAMKAKLSEKTTKVVIPSRGWSVIDIEGQLFHDKEADEALVRELEKGLRGSGVEIRRVDKDINDPEVAKTMVDMLHKMLFT